jgi:hypothetical protein
VKVLYFFEKKINETTPCVVQFRSGDLLPSFGLARIEDGLIVNAPTEYWRKILCSTTIIHAAPHNF